MNKLTLAMQVVADRQATGVSLESLGTAIEKDAVAMEALHGEIDDLTLLATNLGTTVVAMEAFGEMPMAHASIIHKQAVGFLRQVGVDDTFINENVPSLEADDDGKANTKTSSGWKRFKDFIKALWEKIVEFLKKAYDFMRKALAKTTLEEKTAIVKLRHLKDELAKVSNGLTISKRIKLAPRHNYVLHEDFTEGVITFQDVLDNLRAYDTVRTKIDQVIPDTVGRLGRALVNVATSLDNLPKDDEAASAQINKISSSSDVDMAISLADPVAMAKRIGAEDGELSLAWDRRLKINVDYRSSGDDKFVEAASRFGYHIEQLDIKTPEADFEAFRINQIAQLLKLAEDFLDQGLLSIHRRKWDSASRTGEHIQKMAEKAIEDVLKRENLDSDARTFLESFLIWIRTTGRLCTAPIVALSAVHLRVVSSILALAYDQIKNHEVSDGEQKRHDDAKKLEEEKERAAAAKRTKK